MLERRDDVAGAEAAYRRADERGLPSGALKLGNLLERRDDLSGAEAADRRADERGSAEGAINLGRLLERRDDLAGAAAAYRRADERGSGVDRNKNDVTEVSCAFAGSPLIGPRHRPGTGAPWEVASIEQMSSNNSSALAILDV